EHRRLHVRDVPAPHLVRRGCYQLVRTASRRGLRSSAMLHLILFTEDPIYRGLRADVHTLIGKMRDDLLGGAVAELGAVDDLEDPAPFGIGHLVARSGHGASPSVLTDLLPLPALDGSRIDAQ